MTKFFSVPTMVTFQEKDATSYHEDFGIAYRDEIICLCCGGIISLSEFEEEENNPLPEFKDLETMPWYNISDYLRM